MIRLIWFLLVPLRFFASWIYLFFAWLYKKKIKPREVPGFQIISVGNITMGGTGKTPFVIYLADKIKNQLSITPAILLRGYKSPMEKNSEKGKASQNASSGIIDLSGKWPTYPLGEKNPGDEALLYHYLKLDAILGVGRNRLKNAQILRKLGIKWAILDDGMQHHKLRKKYEFVLLDTKNPKGGGLIPLGKRRDPLNYLQKATLIVLTRWSEASNIQKKSTIALINKWAPGIPFYRAEHFLEAPYPLMKKNFDSYKRIKWENRTVSAFCAIGNPDSFKSTLKKGLKVNINKFYAFRDHHSFTEKQINKIISEANLNVLMTEKDAVKLKYNQFKKNTKSKKNMNIINLLPLEKLAKLWVAPVRWKFIEDDQRKFSQSLKLLLQK